VTHAQLRWKAYLVSRLNDVRKGREVRMAEIKNEIEELKKMLARADGVWTDRINARIAWLKEKLEEQGGN
jgi:hypothetical protein